MTDTAGLSRVHRTAFDAAVLRGAHALVAAAPLIFRDPFALALAGVTEAEARALAARVPPASAATTVLRARVAEDRLAAVRSRIRQYVVLGAGLDSYALRLGDAGDLVVFEVDDPPAQAWKRRRLAELGLAEPPALRWAPCDFETTPLADALAAAGFDARARCFVSWLGVTQYLTREATTATLAWMAGQAPGSEIVLTFTEDGPQASALRAAVPGGIADRFVNYSPAETIALLRDLGFAGVDHLDPDTADATWFAGRTDGLVAPRIQHIIHATV